MTTLAALITLSLTVAVAIIGIIAIRDLPRPTGVPVAFLCFWA